MRACRVCHCTDDDCSGCIARTGHRCVWVDEDLCSACEPFAAEHETAQAVTHQIAEQLHVPGVLVIILGPRGDLHIGAVAVEHPGTAKFIRLARHIESVIDADRTAVGTPSPPERAACIHCRQDVAPIADIDAIRKHSLTCAESPATKRRLELERQVDVLSRKLAAITIAPEERSHGG